MINTRPTPKNLLRRCLARLPLLVFHQSWNMLNGCMVTLLWPKTQFLWTAGEKGEVEHGLEAKKGFANCREKKINGLKSEYVIFPFANPGLSNDSVGCAVINVSELELSKKLMRNRKAIVLGQISIYFSSPRRQLCLLSNEELFWCRQKGSDFNSTKSKENSFFLFSLKLNSFLLDDEPGRRMQEAGL